MRIETIEPRHATLKDKHSIYESPAQRMDQIDPSDIRLSGDRVLIRDIPEEERIGSIWIPERCQDNDQIRQGIVVAVGPGDRAIEKPESQQSVHSGGYVRTTARAAKCERLPMSVYPGERVLYSRRQESEIYICGERLSMIHEEQSVIAVLGFKDVMEFPMPRPLRDRVLVSRDAVHQKTGSLFIPQASAEERPEGRVVAVGLGKMRIDGTFKPLEVQPGDHIAFGKYAGSDLKIKGERFLVMREDDVYGVLTE